MNKSLRILIILILAFSAWSGSAQDLDDPKVGLVLSGGGAKGFAHIGVLKVIDSIGLKVDYVAGTSMGAVIGALYASGYSGKQLDSIFNTTDFDELIGDEIPRASKSFFERQNDERYAISLPFDKFKIQLPSAISRGQNVFNLLSRLTLHVSHIDNFKELPIPFFCIATNIETGEEVILDKGSLPQAIEASGAFPSLFQPVEIDGKLLIDGGVLNNYPVEKLRAKGMDLIVGVDVQDELAVREELRSAPDILLQINNFRTIKAMKEKSGKTDIYIKPDIKDFTVISFSQGGQIIENGKKAALGKQTELAELAAKQKLKPINRKNIIIADSLKINELIINEDANYPRSYIMGKLKFKAGEKISYKKFKKGINNLVATDNFKSLLYDFQPEGDGYRLSTHLKQSENSAFIKLGVHYDDLYNSAALLNLTKKRLLFSNDALSLDVILGDNVRYNFDYFLDKGFYWSIGLRSRYNEFHKNIIAGLILSPDQIEQTGLNKLDIELSDWTHQFFLQTLFRRDFALSLGLEQKHLKIISETFVEDQDKETTFENSDFLSAFGQLKFDTFDNKYFPGKGFLFDGDFHWYLSSSDFNNNFSPFSIAKANIGYAFKPATNFSVTLGSQGGFKIGEDSNNSLNFALGGYGNDLINNFIPFWGYDFISITGNSFVKGYINLDYQWLKNHHMLFSANYSNTGDDIFENGEWITNPDFSGYGIGYAIETLIGPVEARYSWSPETGRAIWFFNLGFWF
ncbi:MAG: patatin-like phospholipase family protein [Bacteroidia bacterium]|nr:patatin-like phospholipase family protein [Bacteroidia bacterium]